MKRFLNPLMVWGAVLGWMIFGALGLIRDTWRHHGAGYVTYDEPDRTERVPEAEYKRHQYVEGGLLLALGLMGWGIVAKIDYNGTDKAVKRDIL